MCGIEAPQSYTFQSFNSAVVFCITHCPWLSVCHACIQAYAYHPHTLTRAMSLCIILFSPEQQDFFVLLGEDGKLYYLGPPAGKATSAVQLVYCPESQPAVAVCVGAGSRIITVLKDGSVVSLTRRT